MLASRRPRRERGSAVVEFALVVPVLLILVLGIAEFGRAYQVQTMLSAAAREGARAMALQNSVSAARSTTRSFFPALNLTDAQVAISPANCTVGQAAQVTVTQPFTFITGMFGNNISLRGQGSMRCSG